VVGSSRGTVDMCSPQERVICSRPERLGLPWCPGPSWLRFGGETPATNGGGDVAVNLRPSGRWEFVVSSCGLPGEGGASNR
jgi:hypothetical protein